MRFSLTPHPVVYNQRGDDADDSCRRDFGSVVDQPSEYPTEQCPRSSGDNPFWISENDTDHDQNDECSRTEGSITPAVVRTRCEK